MFTTIMGVVTNGVVVPNSPLPEGARVEIRLQPVSLEVSAELQEEFDGWERRVPAPSKWSKNWPKWLRNLNYPLAVNKSAC